jgi:Pentapeptide repeats (9 copies)
MPATSAEDRKRVAWPVGRGSWWWLASLLAGPAVLSAAIAVVLLLALVDAETAQDQIELIKTGLAIGAAVGAGCGLVLVGRRQWAIERANRVSERAADDSRHDAGERRITDLYSKAADQLGSEKAAVRLAGLYSLERLAQDTPPLRQTIVNLLCAYLRMPSEVSSDQEIEVRRTVQRIFATHLRPSEPASFWPDIDLDLTDAVLHVFDLKGARLRNGHFGGAKFTGRTWFDGARFDGQAVFGGVTFEHLASFLAVHFGADARFSGAEFTSRAVFDDAVFDGEALFGGERHGRPDPTTFSSAVSFSGAVFATPPVIDPSVELD